MFDWLKKRTKQKTTQSTETARTPTSAKAVDPDRPSRTAAEVFEAFYDRHKVPTPLGIHALIDAGAADLPSKEDVLYVCDQIRKHCDMEAFVPSARRELTDDELLPFLRWHQTSEVSQEAYYNADTVLQMIKRFRSECRPSKP